MEQLQKMELFPIDDKDTIKKAFLYSQGSPTTIRLNEYIKEYGNDSRYKIQILSRNFIEVNTTAILKYKGVVYMITGNNKEIIFFDTIG